MPRRYKKTHLVPKPFLILGLVLNVTVGLMFSPITRLARVRVTGAPNYDKQRITDVIASIDNMPCFVVNPFRIESKALENPQVKWATFHRVLFGSGRLELQYRKPVARLSRDLNVLVDADGVLFRDPDFRGALPNIDVPAGRLENSLLLVQDVPIGSLVQLAMATEGIADPTSIQIQLRPGGVVCLNILTGRVILGNFDRIDAKLKTLRSLLSRDPQLLVNYASVDLNEPSVPAFQVKKVNSTK